MRKMITAPSSRALCFHSRRDRVTRDAALLVASHGPDRDGENGPHDPAAVWSSWVEPLSSVSKPPWSLETRVWLPSGCPLGTRDPLTKMRSQLGDSDLRRPRRPSGAT